MQTSRRVALIVGLILILLLTGCGKVPEPYQPPTVALVVRVVDLTTGNPVPRLDVIITVIGTDGFPKEITDNSGQAHFANALPNEKNFVQVFIAADGYETYNQGATIDKNTPLFVAQLKPYHGPTFTPTPSPTPTETFAPVPVPDTPTPTGTFTPVPPSDTPTPSPTVETPTVTPTATFTPTPPVIEQELRIETSGARVGIPGVTVTIVWGDTELWRGVTGSEGLVTLLIDSAYIGETIELSLKAEGYQSYSQQLELAEGNLPGFIRLTRDSIRPTGKLAVPLELDLPKVYVVNTEGTLLYVIDQARQPDYARQKWANGTPLIINGDGGDLNKLRVVQGPDATQWRQIGDAGLAGHSHPAWAPDTQAVIYDDNTIFSNWHIFWRDLANQIGPGDELKTGIGQGQITDPNPLYPLWTTGNRFIFRGCSTWDDQTGTCGLWLMPGRNGTPQRLSSNFNHIPTDIWGDTLVFVSSELGNWNVYKLNLNSGGAPQQLTSDTADESLAAISPDGRWVAYLSNTGAGLSVWYVSINGGNPARMFSIPTQEWGRLAPNGWSEERLSWGEE